jgi:hypothetical protein
MEKSWRVAVAAVALFALLGASAAEGGECLRCTVVPVQGLRYLTSAEEVEVTRGSLMVSWEPCPGGPVTQLRTLNVLLQAEVRGLGCGEAYVLQACGSVEVELGSDTPAEVALPISIVHLGTLRREAGRLGLRLQLRPGVPEPQVTQVSLAQL